MHYAKELREILEKETAATKEERLQLESNRLRTEKKCAYVNFYANSKYKIRYCTTKDPVFFQSNLGFCEKHFSRIEVPLYSKFKDREQKKRKRKEQSDMSELNKFRIMNIQEPFFSLLADGIKKVDGRKATEKWLSLKIGEKVIADNEDGEQKLFVITDIRKYPNVREYLINEGLRNTVPGTVTIEEGIDIYRRWSTNKELKAHFLAIEMTICQ